MNADFASLPVPLAHIQLKIAVDIYFVYYPYCPVGYQHESEKNSSTEIPDTHMSQQEDEKHTTKTPHDIEQNFLNFVAPLQGKLPSFIQAIQRLPNENKVIFLTTTQEGAEFEEFRNKVTMLNEGYITFTFKTVTAFQLF